MNLKEVIQTIADPNAGLEWDEAWDCLKRLNQSYKSELPLLYAALAKPDLSLRIFAIRGIAKVEDDFETMARHLTPLLTDGDYEVRREAVAIL